MSDRYKRVSEHTCGQGPAGDIVEEWTSGHCSVMGLNFHVVKQLPDGRLIEYISSNGGHGWHYVERTT